MAKQSTAQKKTVERVMHEFKEGELESSAGRKVKSKRQAVAIALSEAGSSNRQSPSANKRALGRAKRRESAGETASGTGKSPTRTSSARKRPAKKSAAKKITAKKTAARKTIARKTAAKKTATKKTAAKKTAKKRTAAKKSPARKATAKRAPARTSRSGRRSS